MGGRDVCGGRWMCCGVELLHNCMYISEFEKTVAGSRSIGSG